MDPLRIVLKGDGFVVVDKPTGLLSVPGKHAHNQDCVPARVREMFPDATGPLVVHRLDMDTSGLLVLGLTPGAQRDLSGQFERRETRKRYVALLAGDVVQDSGEVSLPLRADLQNRPWQVVDRELGREAVTRYRVLARETDRTRVEFVPVTGRTHQLRVHAGVGLGCPIIGDILYGPVPREANAERLMLHACELEFKEPGSGRWVKVASAVPF